jgi:phosphoglycerol transferase MdoB-like AlkP superfamily enzyme
MVFSDFAMFSQAFKHPRLYFPFLGLAPVIIMPLLIIGLIILVLMLEPALAFTWQRILATLSFIVILYIVIKNNALSTQLSLEPAEDNTKLGLINAVAAYLFQSRTISHKEKIKQTLRTAPFYARSAYKKSPNKKQANITVIQSESFFDARRLHPSIKSELLKTFDQCNKESLQYGQLKVPAWGANTMRTEFSFLTGLAYEDLGFYRYYPYEYLAEMPVTSIASALKQRGYHCVCIHPHPASFFGRDKIFPAMGFDEFIDGSTFNADTDKFGPYISDQAVAQKVLEVTQQKTDKPLFIFVITMENHGPLHLEKINQEEQAEYFNNKPDTPQQQDELGIYLRHLKNADEMIKTLTQAYSANPQDTLLCLYGDHVPSLPKIYADNHYDNPNSDYFIWHSKEKKSSKNKQEVSIQSLASLLISLEV